MTFHLFQAKPPATRSVSGLLAVAGAAFGVGLLGGAPAGPAEIIGLSATGFTRHCGLGGCVHDGTDESSTHDGVVEMTGQSNAFYADVDFPRDGDKICSLSLVYRDVNGNDAITARLFRKSFSSGGNPFSAPTLIATAASASGTLTTTRITKKTLTTPPTVAQSSGFYYVEVDAPTINLAFLGVQIDVRSSC